MKELITVTGPVSGDDAGFIQSHEHLFLSKGKSLEVSPVLYMDDVDKSAAEAARYKGSGGGTIVEAQPVGCGRMAPELREVSERTGVHILSSTGFHKMCFYPEDHWNFTMTEDELAALYVTELTEGMYVDCDLSLPEKRTDIRAGLIKTALDAGEFTPQYEKLFSAAAAAAVTTGRTMMVHIEAGSDPMALLKFLRGKGVRDERIVFCHTDRASDEDTRRALIDEGIYLEMDTIGRFKYHSDEYEIAIFKDLIARGGESRLLFSLDTTNARMKSYTPDAIGLDYLINIFLPMLRSEGVSDRIIGKLSHDNPVAAFGV